MYEHETQRRFVERVLRSDGRIAVADVLWHTTHPDGSKAAITRLASVIHTLRHLAGWEIETEDEAGKVAVYLLRFAPPSGVRPPIAAVGVSRASTPVPEQPEWSRGWSCADCGGSPASEPSVLLGGMARAHCRNCGQSRYFKRRDVAS